MRTFTFNNLEQHLVKNKLRNTVVSRVTDVALNFVALNFTILTIYERD